jgi:hypothetical protein
LERKISLYRTLPTPGRWHPSTPAPGIYLVEGSGSEKKRARKSGHEVKAPEKSSAKKTGCGKSRAKKTARKVD